MAFVPAVAPLTASTFHGDSAITSTSRPVNANNVCVGIRTIRMAGLTDKERKSFAKVGGASKWRENLFTGGFPGGEAAFREWLEAGMEGEVDDLPKYLQPTTSFEKSTDSRFVPGVLETAERGEFFKAFKDAVKNVVSSSPTDNTNSTDAPAVELKFGSGDDGAPSSTIAVADRAAPTAPTDQVPPESLYEAYFPADKRNLAPHIEIVYEKNAVKDRVGVSMQEVAYNGTENYFPKEYSGMAPFIDIQYTGNLATAKVGVRMDMVSPLPSPAPPVAKGETVTTLVPGSGGGLKLDFTTQE